MIWSDVAAALPAAVIAAVAADPNGLIAESQVYVSEERRLATSQVEAWGFLTSTSPEDLGALLGGQLLGWELTLHVGGASPSDAALESWGKNLRAYFSGRPLSVTDLVSQAVMSWSFEEIPGEGPGRELVITLMFVGVDWPLVTTSA